MTYNGLRIGVTGASCSGKTHVSASLAEALNLPVAGEGAREAAQYAGISSTEVLSSSNSELFQTEVLAQKIRYEDQCNQGFVSDRTVIDCAVYFLLRSEAGILSSETSRRLKDFYFEKIGQRLSTAGYDVLVILDYGRFEWVDDGFRSHDDHIFPALLENVLRRDFKRSLQTFDTQIIRCPIEVHDQVNFILESLSHPRGSASTHLASLKQK